jgi:heme exporter protein D
VARARDHPRARAWIRVDRRAAGDGARMMEFFAMGGYGLYVWGAYGVTALAIALEVVSVRARWRAARKQARS